MHPKAAIQRALAGELSEREEARLRAHLRTCERCRTEYDEQALLLRALAGDPEAPTAGERERQVRLALAAAFPGSQPEAAWEGRSGWLTRAPRPALVAVGLVLVLVITGLGVWLASGPDSNPTSSPVAVVVSSSAAVILPEPQGGAQGAILTGVPVLSVAPRGWIELSLQRGGKLRLSGGAQATLSAAGRQLTLVAGRAACQIDPGQGSFRVDTPSARVRVVGTAFDVEVTRAGATRVQVGQGEVEVSDRHGQASVRLKAGHHTRVESGHKPAAPARIRREPVSEPVSEWELVRQGLRQAGRDFADLFR